MSVRVKLPAVLKEFSGGIKSVEVNGRTVRECLDELDMQFPGMSKSLFDREGKLLHAFGIFLNGEYLKTVGLDTQLQDGDEIVVLNFLMGG